jgi:hypothetical protein
MTDPWQTKVDARPPRPGLSPAMIAAIATSVAVLAIIGATGGYLLASATPTATGTPAPEVSAAPLPSASASTGTLPSEMPGTSASPTSSAVSGTLPAGVGTDFRPYFAQLRGLRLGVALIFAEPGAPGTVIRTEPAAGSSIRSGLTIKVYVAGEPPQTDLPTVIGVSCRDARVPLGAVGLLPTYPTGQSGMVLSQSPDPQAGGTARWNDHVEISCGTPQATATP